jgi:hypothetical protein
VRTDVGYGVVCLGEESGGRQLQLDRHLRPTWDREGTFGANFGLAARCSTGLHFRGVLQVVSGNFDHG